ncbi:MAG: hypothetical protein JWN70_4038, partial [Planctomycetaceae bacterium]|nr:hypothetical protein [Planctomycetaceae bacterium]
MRSDSLLARLGVILGFSAGFQVLYVIGLGAVILIVVTRPVPPGSVSPTSAVIVVDGQPLLTKGLALGGVSVSRVLDGQAVTLADKQIYFRGVPLGIKREADSMQSNMRLNRWGAVGFTLDSNRSARWYFIHERSGNRRRGYFVNYSNQTLAPSTYLGTQGECATPPPPHQQFELAGLQNVVSGDGIASMATVSAWTLISGHGSTLNRNVYVLSTSGLDRIDLQQHQVVRVVAENDLQSIFGRPEYQIDLRRGDSSHQTFLQTLLLRGRAAVYVIEDKQIKAKYVIPQSLRGVDFGAFPIDANSIYYVTAESANYTTDTPQRLWHSDASGRITQDAKILQPPRRETVSNSDEFAMTALYPSPLLILSTSGMDLAYSRTP